MSDPMLTQAIENLQALICEMRVDAQNCDYVSDAIVQCWVDKAGTVLADLQEAQAAKRMAGNGWTE